MDRPGRFALDLVTELMHVDAHVMPLLRGGSAPNFPQKVGLSDHFAGMRAITVSSLSSMGVRWASCPPTVTLRHAQVSGGKDRLFLARPDFDGMTQGHPDVGFEFGHAKRLD